MPIPFSISKEDMMRSKLVSPGWYLCNIKNITSGPGKNDPQSTTITIELIIKDGVDKSAIGVPLTYWVSEKAAGLAVAFVEAATGKKLPDDGINFNFENCQGRDIKVYVKNDKWNNRMTNKCEDFAPATAA